jgi:hypothetical protein
MIGTEPLGAHGYALSRERDGGPAGMHIESFIVDASIFAASVTIGCRVFGRSQSTSRLTTLVSGRESDRSL